jgi:hypothetical protein
MTPLDPFIYKDEEGTLWRIDCAADLPTIQPHFLLFECDSGGNYDPLRSYGEEWSLYEIQRHLTIVGTTKEKKCD